MDAQQTSRLTAQWIRELPGEESTVLSGLGVWPLLAILAELAVEPARSELAAVAGAQYDGLLAATPELRMALGLWTRPEVPLEPCVDKVVPPEVRGVLTNQQVLDDWVVEQTDGLIQRMPVMLTPDVLLVLASALALRTTWRLEFRETSAAALELEGEGVGGAALLTGQEAPGVEVIESMSPTPTAILSLPYFEVDVEHDLLEHAEVFGLVTASDTSRGHFPGLSPMPLAVGQRGRP